MKIAVAYAGLIGSLLLAVLPANAATAESWSASTAADFSLGTLDGVALDERGQVRLAPAVRTLWGPEGGVVWAVAPSADGSAFVALSGPARVIRVDRSGSAESWYETREERLITALVDDGAGGILFGESPEGRILRGRRTAAGTIDLEPFLETEALFVWSLARDRDGNLWIGTGVPGKLIRLTPGGESRTMFDAGDDPVRCIQPLSGGGVVFGTGGRGRVVRVGADGKAFVLHDADEAEIVSIATDGAGTIFALAAQAAKQPGPRASGASATPTASNSVTVVAEPPPDPEGPEGQQGPAAAGRTTRAQIGPPSLASQPGGRLYRIDPEGDVRAIWSTSRDMPFAMVLDRDRLLVATGDAGRLYALDREGRASRLLRVASTQASALALAADGSLLVGGTSDARLEAVEAGPRGEGSYLTPPIDAGSSAAWGRLHWIADLPAGSRIEIEVRSGNTSEADDTWTPWVRLRPAKDGRSAEAELPTARWLQGRFRLFARSESPILRSVEIAYQPRNRSPVIRGFDVEPTGVVWLRGPVQSAFAAKPLVAEDPVARKISAGLTQGRVGAGTIRKTYEPGARTCSWSAEDPDDDRLRFGLEIRRDGSDDWFPLAVDLDDQFYSWDARGMPDGSYRLRLRVDDALDNPNGTHRTAEEISEILVIDNTRPSVEKIEVRPADGTLEVSFVANDRGGTVAAVEVAVDGGEWTPLSPVDGVADSESESYRLVIPSADMAAAPALMLRVIDAAGNLGGAFRRVRP